MIIYTSGTTGKPKGAVHVHGGFPLKSAVDLAHCFDLQRGDVLFWFTDMGWMMGPWAVAGALLLGATLVIYEGTPDFPGRIGCGTSPSATGSPTWGSAPPRSARS